MPETSTQVKQIRYLGDKRVPLKELRKEFYKIRKFEIQNLWQRSIFLATFIVLLFTGYGAFLEKLMSYDGLQSIIGHIICCLLALIGSIFSMLWIMMAKGSKAWFEIYERRIGNIEKEKILNIPEDYRMQEGSPEKLNNSLWSRDPGAYSVSKINILIGQVLWLIWILIFALHAISLLALAYFMYQETSLCVPISITIASVSLFLIMYLTVSELPKILFTVTESTAITDPNKKGNEGKEGGEKQETESKE